VSRASPWGRETAACQGQRSTQSAGLTVLCCHPSTVGSAQLVVVHETTTPGQRTTTTTTHENYYKSNKVQQSHRKTIRIPTSWYDFQLLFHTVPFFCSTGPFFARESRMLRASLPSSGRLSVCLSVCLSVTLVSCIKTVQARITKSSLWAAPRSLVYRDKISCHCL